MLLLNIIPIIGDGACLFLSLDFLIYGTQVKAREVREHLVEHVAANWENFSIMPNNQERDNYNSSIEYLADMSNPFTYGGLCELVAAGQIYPFRFEVGCNAMVHFMSFGIELAPVKKLCFSLDSSMGHFDVYMQINDFSKHNYLRHTMSQHTHFHHLFMSSKNLLNIILDSLMLLLEIKLRMQLRNMHKLILQSIILQCVNIKRITPTCTGHHFANINMQTLRYIDHLLPHITMLTLTYTDHRLPHINMLTLTYTDYWLPNINIITQIFTGQHNFCITKKILVYK